MYIGTPFQSAQMTLGDKKKIKGTQSLVVALLRIISSLGPQGNEEKMFFQSMSPDSGVAAIFQEPWGRGHLSLLPFGPPLSLTWNETLLSSPVTLCAKLYHNIVL